MRIRSLPDLVMLSVAYGLMALPWVALVVVLAREWRTKPNVRSDQASGEAGEEVTGG